MVEQSPGQGYAKVRISSNSFAPLRQRPVELDWTKMSVVEEERDTILAKLVDEGRIAYPNVQTYPGHAVLWHPRSRHGDAAALLEAYQSTPLIISGRINPDGAEVLGKVRSVAAIPVRPFFEGQYLDVTIEERGPVRFLGTDGAVPKAVPDLPVPDKAETLLDLALEKAEVDYAALAALRAPDPAVVRQVVGFATWCYWRCPKSIVENLLDWYEAGGAGAGGDLIVRLQGLGRVLHQPDDVRRFMSAVNKRLRQDLPMRDPEYAALGRILGGCEEAAALLEPPEADRFLQATCGLIEARTGKRPIRPINESSNTPC